MKGLELKVCHLHLEYVPVHFQYEVHTAVTATETLFIRPKNLNKSSTDVVQLTKFNSPENKCEKWQNSFLDEEKSLHNLWPDEDWKISREQLSQTQHFNRNICTDNQVTIKSQCMKSCRYRIRLCISSHHTSTVVIVISVILPQSFPYLHLPSVCAHVPTKDSHSCSWLTGREPHLVFCHCNPSVSWFWGFCTLRCFPAHYCLG